MTIHLRTHDELNCATFLVMLWTAIHSFVYAEESPFLRSPMGANRFDNDDCDDPQDNEAFQVEQLQLTYSWGRI